MSQIINVSEKGTTIADMLFRSQIEGLSIDGSFGILPSSGYLYDGTNNPEDNGIVLNVNRGLASRRMPITKVAIVRSISMESSAHVLAQLSFGGGNSGVRAQIGPNTPFCLYDPTLVKPKEFISITSLGLTREVKNASGTVTNKGLVSGSYRGAEMSTDLNFGAPYSILILGDSNSEATAIAPDPYLPIFSDQDVWTHILCNYYKASGQNARIIDKSKAGYSTVNFLTMMNRGELNTITAPNILFIDLGTNDGAAPATYKTNLEDILDYFTKKWPKMKIVVNGPIVHQTAEAQMAVIRTNANDVVTALANPNVIYINNGAFWLPTDNSQYSGTEAAGAGVHMGVKGQNTKATALWNALPPAFKKLA